MSVNNDQPDSGLLQNDCSASGQNSIESFLENFAKTLVNNALQRAVNSCNQPSQEVDHDFERHYKVNSPNPNQNRKSSRIVKAKRRITKTARRSVSDPENSLFSVTKEQPVYGYSPQKSNKNGQSKSKKSGKQPKSASASSFKANAGCAAALNKNQNNSSLHHDGQPNFFHTLWVSATNLFSSILPSGSDYSDKFEWNSNYIPPVSGEEKENEIASL